ncbi:MAG TPA: mechanosensitive ion channel family protein [Actinomycetes bacterium]|nr:mechanosensitive ion channel family protein [Actinomycetes bacterium]
MLEPLELPEILVATVLIVGGPILGWLLQRTIIAGLKRRATITAWGGDDIIIHAVHDVLVVWLAVAGVFAAASVLPLNARLEGGLERLLVALLIISATVVIARVAAGLIRLYSQRAEGVMRSTSIFVNIARFLILVIGILVLLQTYGVSIAPILTALGIGGLAVALALQDTLSNLFAGLQLIATRKVKPGDFVQLETGQQGYVTDLDWRHTSIRMLPNNLVLVPNSKLVDSVVVNCYYPDQEMAVLVDVGVAYDSDLGHVERVTVEVAAEVLHDVEGGVSDFRPFLRYHTFNDSSIDFTVILRAREFTDQYLLKHEFVKRLHRRYKAEGIVIPFPIRTLDLPSSVANPSVLTKL